MLVSDLDVSPDGMQVAFIYRRENARNHGNLAEVGLARLDDGKLVRLTENEAPESRVRWSPNGREVGYLAPDDKNWELKQSKLFVLDVQFREPRLVSGNFEGDISDYTWSLDGTRALLSAGVKTNRGIFELDVAGQDVKQLVEKQGSANDVAFSADGRKAAFVWSSAVHPPDVFSTSLPGGSELHRLSDANPHFRHKVMGRFQIVTWRSKNGLPIEGLLFLPSNRQDDQRVPLILQIHGGPAGVFTDSWRTAYHIFAGLGYAVLCPNVRGSTAYGDELLRGNMNDIGGGDFDDLMTGVDRLIEDGIVDPEHMGVRGWSYGGILGGWVITKTDRFKAAALGAMVADWTSEYGQGFSHDVRLWYIGGDPWSNPEGYRKMSALTHIQNVSTPTLLLHGERDMTDTIQQSMNFFNALWEKGTPTRFIRFPREGHGIREPRHHRTRLVEEIAWMQKHIRGIDWSDERKDLEKDQSKPARAVSRESDNR
jgi:dipeptidyl aminopeptidase/acylaminoacyl peptidase